MPLKRYFCGSLYMYSLEKKRFKSAWNSSGSARVKMEERRTEDLFFLIFRLEVTGRFREKKKKVCFTFQLSLR